MPVFRILGVLLVLALLGWWTATATLHFGDHPAPALLGLGSAFEGNLQLPVATIKAKFDAAHDRMIAVNLFGSRLHSAGNFAAWLSFAATASPQDRSLVAQALKIVEEVEGPGAAHPFVPGWSPSADPSAVQVYAVDGSGLGGGEIVSTFRACKCVLVNAGAFPKWLEAHTTPQRARIVLCRSARAAAGCSGTSLRKSSLFWDGGLSHPNLEWRLLAVNNMIAPTPASADNLAQFESTRSAGPLFAAGVGVK